MANLVAVMLTASLLVSTLLAGSRYFYCWGMQESLFTSCCTDTGQEDRAAADALRSVDCCLERRVQGLPLARVASGPMVASAPLVATIASLPSYPPSLALVIRCSLARSGSDPPTPSRARSQLMVFLT
jgi:hypothetical protein